VTPLKAIDRFTSLTIIGMTKIMCNNQWLTSLIIVLLHWSSLPASVSFFSHLLALKFSYSLLFSPFLLYPSHILHFSIFSLNSCYCLHCIQFDYFYRETTTSPCHDIFFLFILSSSVTLPISSAQVGNLKMLKSHDSNV
jgi:hypothetical protein